MFYSLQIIWYPIDGLIHLLVKVCRSRTRASHKSTDLESSTGIDLDSTWATAKQDTSHIDVIEVQEECGLGRKGFHEGGKRSKAARYFRH
ncbi:hypothetical protein N7456_011307 [Penicillium angulare]|uniref:Uncharacterized protein n=1 Tax=Penicillium angulare TaxID=116970 RepID=A0A9W9K018_9EURO|nr:hypothetical protein N7456_011307 [Penicillium angulare]